MFGAVTPHEFVRLAPPRRVYTASHVDWVIETAERVARRLDRIPGYRIVREPPLLRHFTAELAVLD
ncbi:MAG: hypothetical protein IPI67_30130 [Myxococcales bacterium]|nr:hypothetical protein [Myxococcales bacterium]